MTKATYKWSGGMRALPKYARNRRKRYRMRDAAGVVMDWAVRYEATRTRVPGGGDDVRQAFAIAWGMLFMFAYRRHPTANDFAAVGLVMPPPEFMYWRYADARRTGSKAARMRGKHRTTGGKEH